MRFLFIVFSLLATVISANSARAEVPKEIKELFDQGKYEQVLTALEPYFSNAFDIWTVPLNPREDSIYFGGTDMRLIVIQDQDRAAGPALPEQQRIDLTTIAKFNGTQTYRLISVMDVTKGTTLWTASLSADGLFAGIDPRDQAVWLWGYGWWLKLNGDTGELIKRGELRGFSDGDGTYRAMVDNKTVIKQLAPFTNFSNSSFRGWNVSTGEDLQSDKNPLLQSIDPRQELIFEGGKLKRVLKERNPKETNWEFGADRDRVIDAVWAGDDVYAISIDKNRVPTIHRLQGKSRGGRYWKTVLRDKPLSADSYSFDRRRPPMVVGKNDRAIVLLDDREIVAVGNEDGGKLVSIDLGDKARAPIVPVDDDFIVATQSRIARIPVQRRTTTVDTVEELLELRIQTLVKLGRVDDAIKVANDALKYNAKSPNGNKAFIDLMDQASSPAAARTARLATMINLGTEVDHFDGFDELVRFIPTSPIQTPMVPYRSSVLVGTIDQDLISLDAVTGAIIDQDKTAQPISDWWVDGTKLVTGDTPNQIIRESTRAPELARFGDPLERPGEPKDLPKAWYESKGDQYNVIRQTILGRRTQTLVNGGVRYPENGEVKEILGKIEALQEWLYAFAGDKPYAIGNGGIYSLDENLVPEKIYFDPPNRDPNSNGKIVALAGDDDTIAFLTEGTLQIWRKSDWKRLRLVQLDVENGIYSGSNPRGYPEVLVLQATGYGYLFVSKELLYVSKDPSVPEWRMRAQLIDFTIPEHQRDPGRSFHVPRIVGDRLFVTINSGGILVLDLKKMDKKQASSQ